MAIRRFTARFQHIESALRTEGVALGDATLEHLERHWQDAKAREKALPAPTWVPRAPVTTLRLGVADLPAQRAFVDCLRPPAGVGPPEAPGGGAGHL
ncbi:hypothetical protein ACLEPN_33275 [Myxococcus sp. 1LA]